MHSEPSHLLHCEWGLGTSQFTVRGRYNVHCTPSSTMRDHIEWLQKNSFLDCPRPPQALTRRSAYYSLLLLRLLPRGSLKTRSGSVRSRSVCLPRAHLAVSSAHDSTTTERLTILTPATPNRWPQATRHRTSKTPVTTRCLILTFGSPNSSSPVSRRTRGRKILLRSCATAFRSGPIFPWTNKAGHCPV